MLVPGRNYQGSDKYRYGFNGQEQDDEIKGEGNSVNYKYRMHDPRIMRFFATDPIAKKFPELTPYQFASNNPIWMIEWEGLEGIMSSGGSQPFSNDSRPTHQVMTASDGVKAANNIKEKLYDTHHRANSMMQFYEKNEYLLTQEERPSFGKYQVYMFAWFKDYGQYTDLEDPNVFMTGKTISGDEAGLMDYSFAGVGMIIPFVSGGTFKQIIKHGAGDLFDRGKMLYKATPGKTTTILGRLEDTRALESTLDNVKSGANG